MVRLNTEFTLAGAKEKKLDIPGFDSPNVTYAVETLTGAVVTKYADGVSTVAQKTRNIPNANGRAAQMSLTGLGAKIVDVPRIVWGCPWDTPATRTGFPKTSKRE